MWIEYDELLIENSMPEGDTLMTSREINAELPRLSHHERREIVKQVVSIEEEAELLADCGRRANERFQMFDAMEAEDERASAG